MTIESDAFEKLNARIEILRQGSAARVQWNARIPDPDDPTQERQIDVLIDKNGVLTGVECRLRSAAQSVMWIEELIGRKQSLGLNGMIGIAVEGFTELALKKAKRYGIILYDYRHLSDAEIASWTNAATVEAVYVQFDPLVILAGVSQANANRLQANPVFKYQNKDGYSAVMDLVRDDVADNPGGQRYKSLNINGFSIDGIPLTFLATGYTGHLVNVKSSCVAVEAVGVPEMPISLRDITVQRFNHSVSQVIRRQDDAHIVVDVSEVQPPSDSILHELKITFPTTTTVTGYELVGGRTILTNAKATMLQVMATP